MSTVPPIKLKVPRQDLDRSSYFSLEGEAADNWIEHLPMTNVGQTSRQLYLALSELNRVRMLPDKRLLILDKLRKPIYFISRALTKHYINQPIVLPEQARKVANLADTLHQLQATGYTIVATHAATLGKRTGNKPALLIAPALHRAITDISLNIIRRCQLYEPIKAGAWETLHQFYLLAKQQKLLTTRIEDIEYGDSSIEDNYIRALLIGCARPNQLRQEDFNGLLKPMVDWASRCQLQPYTPQSLFVLDLDGNSPPVYQELTTDANDLWLSLDTRQLVNDISVLRSLAEPGTLKIATGDSNQLISVDLMGHLIVAWGSMSKRTFIRLEAEDSLDLAIGLSATHHFVSNEMSFNALTHESGVDMQILDEDNPFLKVNSKVRSKDVWDSSFDPSPESTSVAIESIDYHIRNNEKDQKGGNQKYRSHNVQMVNSSAHGYCIECPSDNSMMVKTGEIIGIKESHNNNWSIAVIRWVSRNQQQTQLGLELINPSAAPYGARIVRTTGEQADYMRALVLPEVESTQQPMTVLTPRVPFRTGVKVVLNQRGKEIQITLGKKLNDTGAYNQFEFKRMNTIEAPTSDDDEGINVGDDFDSLWTNL
ncbi:MAG: hypothetical protein ACJAYG_001020 [Oceanicoccus sp.]|jgi:hypothetical protein